MGTSLHLPNTLRRPRRAARPPVPAPPKLGAAPSKPDAAPSKPDAAPSRPDADACKVREAGGPLDQAAYVCLCGFAFAAAVSTSVECPHCGSAQAW
jgi:hypothetical protein